MPFGDGTGPEGKGPKTGRGLGRCSGSDKPGYESEEAPMGLRRGIRGLGSGRGLGRGAGAGRGIGRGAGAGRGAGRGWRWFGWFRR